MSGTSTTALGGKAPPLPAPPAVGGASRPGAGSRGAGEYSPEQQKVLSLCRQARLAPALWIVVEMARRGGVSAWLEQADLQEDVSLEDVARVKLAFGVVLGLLGASVGVMIGQPAYGVLMAVGLGTLGTILPDRAIRSAATMRQRRLARALPLALEVVGLTVERSSIDAAIQHYCHHFSDTVLAEELSRAMDRAQKFQERLDVELGKVLRKNGNEDLSFLVAAVGQASQVGGGDLRELLARQAAQLRDKQALETKAQSLRAPVLMMFPIVLNVLALLVVLGGLAAAAFFFK